MKARRVIPPHQTVLHRSVPRAGSCAYKWTILRNSEIRRLNRLCWFGHVQRMEDNRISKRVLCMNLERTRLRNRWQDEVREDGRLVGGRKGI